MRFVFWMQCLFAASRTAEARCVRGRVRAIAVHAALRGVARCAGGAAWSARSDGMTAAAHEAELVPSLRGAGGALVAVRVAAARMLFGDVAVRAIRLFGADRRAACRKEDQRDEEQPCVSHGARIHQRPPARASETRLPGFSSRPTLAERVLPLRAPRQSPHPPIGARHLVSA